MNLNFYAIALLFALPIATLDHAHACGSDLGWAMLDATTAPTTMDDAIAIAAKNFEVQVIQSKSQSNCGTDKTFDVLDLATGQPLASFPVPVAAIASNDGRILAVRVQQLMATPREQFLALKQAREEFLMDYRSYREELGITFSVPTALPLSERISADKQGYLVHLHLTAGFGKEGHFQMPGETFATVFVRTPEYIPGRSDYSGESIYESGGFKQAIVSNPEVLEKVIGALVENVERCTFECEQWSVYLAYYRGLLGAR